MDLRLVEKVFSRIGLALFFSLLTALGVAVLCSLPSVFVQDSDSVFSSPAWFWLSNIVPMYLLGLPLGLFLMSRKPGWVPERKKLSVGGFLTALCICFFLMYTGNLIGTALSYLLSGGNAENAIAEAVQMDHVLKYVAILVCAPVLEELVFRKFILDRTRQYGEVLAVLVSAAAFGLFHMNFFQFFYAFGIGLVFGYVYLRTGRIGYTMILHAVINFFGGVLAPWILTLTEESTAMSMDPSATMDPALIMEELPQILAMLLFSVTVMGLFVAGLVLFIIMIRKLRWDRHETEIPKGKRFGTVCLNLGVIFFVVLCAAMMVLNLL